MTAVRSMTGYASARGDSPLGAIYLELRSVNSRFLDLALRLPDDFHCCEPTLRELIGAELGRGKIELRLIARGDRALANATVDHEMVARLDALQRSLIRLLPDAAPLTVAQVLFHPGVTREPEVDQREIIAAVERLAREAIAQLLAGSAREGARLAQALRGYCADIDAIAARVRKRVPEIIAAARAKLEERLRHALSDPLTERSGLSPEEVSERIRQEVGLYATKIDVDEEINRLLAHTAEIRRLLDEGGAVGKRLDFLTQELNREANTLASKAATLDIANAGVDLKILIEQTREQAQNLR